MSTHGAQKRSRQGPTYQQNTLRCSKILRNDLQGSSLSCPPAGATAGAAGSLLSPAAAPASLRNQRPPGKQLLQLQRFHCPLVPCRDFSTFLAFTFQNITL